MVGLFALIQASGVLGSRITMGAVLLGGYALRLDAQARGAGFRLLAQERAAREAEATSAALAERARIAGEIRDVLAHSLSAQLVHPEAARSLIQRGPEGPCREQILARVVAARGMARECLAETRRALSALRGEMAPVANCLREPAVVDGAETGVTGERRQLTAEASQAVRRVAQEASRMCASTRLEPARMLLTYAEGEVALEARDSGTIARTGQLGASGAGYGLPGDARAGRTVRRRPGGGTGGRGLRGVRLRVPA
jgi:hypothetical protein